LLISPRSLVVGCRLLLGKHSELGEVVFQQHYLNVVGFHVLIVYPHLSLLFCAAHKPLISTFLK